MAPRSEGFCNRRRTSVKTVPSLPYDGIIPKVMAPESLKEHRERIVCAAPEDSQAPSSEPNLQAELQPVA